MRLLLYSLLALALPAAAQTALSARSASTVSAARCVDILPQATRSRASLAQKTKTILGQSTEGAHAVAFLDSAGHVHAIEVTYFGESGRAIYEFYYAAGNVYLARERQLIYNAPIYMNRESADKMRREEGVIQEPFDDRKTKVQENLYCFGSNKPVEQQEGSGAEEARVLQISEDAFTEFTKE